MIWDPPAKGAVGTFGKALIKAALDVTKRDDAPYGDVEYADPGYRGGKKRYPIDTEEHIRAAWSYIHQERNQEPYTAEQVAAIKRRIVAAWKRKIDEKGPPEAKVAEPPAAHDGFSLPAKAARGRLRKTMQAATLFAQAFDLIRDGQRLLIGEGDIEADGHDKAMAAEAGRIAQALARLTGRKAQHEGGEARSLTDEADVWAGLGQRRG